MIILNISPLSLRLQSSEAAFGRLSHFQGRLMMATNVYLDGFNFYYGSLRNRWPQYKWLDIQEFSQSLLPRHSINRVRYFTARINRTAFDAGAPIRQQLYLRALATLPKVTIHYGHFTSHDVRMPLSNPPASGPSHVSVRRTEEKGSDVNLATYLLLDCFRNDCTEAVVISNDSDLTTPIRVVRDELQIPIGVINPHQRKFRSAILDSVASWTFQDINRRHFRDCQFPQTLTDAVGAFSKPPSW